MIPIKLNHHKLNEKEVMEIRSNYEDSAVVLAEKYKISVRQVHRILNGKCWSWVKRVEQ